MRVLISHYSFATIGGAERVSLNIARTLLEQFGWDITIACFDPPDANKLLRVAGIDHDPGIIFHGVRPPLGNRLQLFKMAHLHRYCRSIAPKYDICISTYNEQDFGKRAIQYIHHPIFESRSILRKYHIIPKVNLIDHVPVLEKIYYALLDLYSGADRSARRRNLTLTNSHFMADVLTECGYEKPEVLYPGFLDESRMNDDDSTIITRAHRIFSLGRIEADKHTLELIPLFAALHRADPTLEMVICGLTGSRSYLNSLTELIKEYDIPISLMLDKNRNEVEKLISDSEYYINPKPFEHFGIATVEAMASGCIPLLHNSGGNRELAGNHPDLLYDSTDQLVSNFLKINQNANLKRSLRTSLMNSLYPYTGKAFYHRFHEIIQSFTQQPGQRD